MKNPKKVVYGSFGIILLFALIFFVALMATDPGPNASPDGLVSDSAGIRLVKNSGPDISIPIQETLRVGVLQGNPDLQFDQIRSLALDGDGGFWVSDSHESVRHYGPDGSFLGFAGGKGEGPGESARGYGDVWFGGGELLVHTYDGDMQLFSKDGTLIGSRSMILSPGRYLSPLGRGDDGWRLVVRDIPESENEVVQEAWVVGSGPATGPGFDSLLVLSGRWLVGDARSRGHGSFFYGVPGIGGDGLGNIHYSHSLQYRIEVFGGSGSLLQVASRDVPGVPYDPDLRGELEEGVREGLKDLLYGGQVPPEAQVMEYTEKALPETLPESLPFLEAIFVSTDGFVWAQRGDRHPRLALRAVAETFGFIRPAWPEEWRAPLHFDLFSPEGVYRGSVVLPDVFIPMAVSRDRIIGSIRDELDVQYVVVFSLG